MELPYINNMELNNITKEYDTILIVVNEEDQMFKMTKGQVIRIKDHYKDRFKYFIIRKEELSFYLKRTFEVLPQLVLMKKNTPVAILRGFRSTKEINKVLELSF